jgi:hypothetical protein
MNHVSPEQAEFADQLEILRMEFEGAAEWRRTRLREFPHDVGNAEAAAVHGVSDCGTYSP